jgi:1,2-diacylglycerol 3-alpha-glucosyltransferase
MLGKEAVMRIGMMTDVYKPHVNGIINYIAINKKYLELAGHEVFVFTFGDEDYIDNEPNVIRSHGLPLVDTGYYISFRHRKRARKLIYSMDVMHVHHPLLSGSLALRYCRPNAIPVIFTNHTRYDLYAQAYFPNLPEIVSETMLHAYLPSFCRACSLVVAPSEGMRQVLLRLGVDADIRVIPNGVNVEPFYRQIEPIDRARFGFSKEDIVLTYVGRLGPEKNLPFLLRSFAGTAQACEDVRLLIIGNGPERDNLQDRVHTMGIADKVFFTGMVVYEDLPRYLAAADAFVTSSVTEVHPLSVIEAMAAGLPVLGIQSPGVGDIVKNGENGLLATEDLAAFTAKMVRLVGEKELRQKMAAEARRTSAQYAIERTSLLMLEQYLHLNQEYAGQKGGFRSRLARLLDDWRS